MDSNFNKKIVDKCYFYKTLILNDYTIISET